MRGKMLSRAACAAITLSAFWAAAPLEALTFNFTNQPAGGAEAGTAARRSFEAAGAYWSSVLTDDVTVNIDIGYYSLGPGNEDVLGSAGSNITLTTVDTLQYAMLLDYSGSSVDFRALTHLPTIDPVNGVAAITPGYTNPATKIGIDTSTRVYDHDGTTNNWVFYMNRANAKALNFAVGPGTNASIQFNSDFAFDFNPTDGIAAGTYDFTLVALHEIGHALGFVSGVDGYDFYGGPSGPCFNPSPACEIAGKTYDANNDWWAAPLDLFRYSTDPDDVAPGGDPVLDWSIRNPADPEAYPDYTANPYFSLDGGATMGLTGEDAYFSRGQFNGASYQASHWRRVGSNNGPGNPTQPFIGIMDPVGRTGNYVTADDIAVFDAIGWDTRIDALENPDYAVSTATIFRLFAPSIPEPATWMQMIAGLGAIGAVLRGRVRRVAFG